MAKADGFDVIDHYEAWKTLKKDDFEAYKK